MPQSISRKFRIEHLESRCLLAADVYISEFMAVNDGILLDENGDDSDWLEIYNAGPDDADLSEYFLTDSRNNLSKWQLPEQDLAAGNHLLVFASGKDRRTSGLQPHTNFKLSGDGEFLALTQPNSTGGFEIVSQFAPEYPQQFGDISFGVGQNVSRTNFVQASGPTKFFLPQDATDDANWFQADFDDTAWTDGSLAIGYQRTQPGFLVEDAKAEGTIENLAEALAVLDGVGQGSRSVAITPTINFRDIEGGGGADDFDDNDEPFPNNTDADDNDFAVRATGYVTIPRTASWGFGVLSDDGASIKVNGEFIVNDDRQHTAEFNFGFIDLEAGEYPIELIYFERGGPAELELFAGVEQPFLIGDVRGGGLVVNTGESGAGFSPELLITDTDEMYQQSSSVYVRSDFVADTSDLPDSLTLSVQYNGGFVAYLNGTEIARRNTPDAITFDALASTERPPHLISSVEAIDISDSLPLLVDGDNVFAIQGLNTAIDNNEFLLTASIANIMVAKTDEVYFKTPTPGGFNPADGVDGFLTDEITFNQSHGFYSEAIDVEISAATPGTTIRYTVDGSEPTAETGVAYSGPIRVEATTTLRARAFLGDRDPSFTETATYIFLDDVITQSSNGRAPENFPTNRNINGQILDYGMDPDIVEDERWGSQLEAALTQVPSMSIVMNVDDLLGAESGIYTNAQSHGRNWERPASLELIYPDGTSGFQINAGVRVRGGFSRTASNPKHAFRFFFRDEYGDGTLNFPLFGDEGAGAFEKMDIRTTQNYSWAFQGDARNTFLRDIFARDSQREMGQPYTRSEYYHLYINGQYWGLFQTQERAEANYAATYFGGDADDYDVVKSAGGSGGYINEATDGDMEAYSRLADFFYQPDGLSDTNMAAYWMAQGMNPDGTRNPDFERLLDVDNLVEYALLLYYTGDRDGPISRFVPGVVNNYFGVYNRESPDGFKFFEHDSEHSLNTGDSSLVTPLTSSGSAIEYFNPQWMHEQLIATNSEYRIRFADHVYEHFFDDGILTTENSQARLDARANEIDLAIIAESARWGDSKRSTPLTKDDWESAVSTTRDWFVGRTELVLDQFRNQGWFDDTTKPPFFTVDGIPTRSGDVFSNSDARILANVLLDNTEIVAAGTTWKYLDDGSNQGTTWRMPNFDDSTWPEGPAQFGYGDDGEQTLVGQTEEGEERPLTVYFRTEFMLDDDFDAYSIRLLRDDGAVVYVNGEPVVVDNMPTDFDFQTEAIRRVSRDDENTFFEHPIDSNVLKPGLNTIAVEVHQTSLTTGGDMSFDLQLLGGNFDSSKGALYYTSDGSDPRLAGGGVRPSATLYEGQPLVVEGDQQLRARVLLDGTWTAIGEASLTPVDGLRGDVNSDGEVNATDIDAIAMAIQTLDEDLRYDLDRDEGVDQDDIDYLVEDILNTRIGDANLDGNVDFEDFLILSANFGNKEATWELGNFGSDLEVSFADFLVLAANFGD